MASNLKNKFIIFTIILCYSVTAFADPVVNGELIPPGEAAYVTDPVILNKLNLGPDDEPVWCYSNLANSLIITSADREKEKCELRLQQSLEKQKALFTLEIDQLNIQLESLNSKHEELIKIKDNQIANLTEAALTQPNDYSVWWASGGVVVGVLSTLAIMFAVK